MDFLFSIGITFFYTSLLLLFVCLMINRNMCDLIIILQTEVIASVFSFAGLVVADCSVHDDDF